MEVQRFLSMAVGSPSMLVALAGARTYEEVISLAAASGHVIALDDIDEWIHNHDGHSLKMTFSDGDLLEFAGANLGPCGCCTQSRTSNDCSTGD